MSLGRLSRNDQVTAIKRAVYLIALPFAAAAGVLLFRLESGQGLPLISGVGLPLLTGLKLVLWLFFLAAVGNVFRARAASLRRHFTPAFEQPCRQRF